MATLARVVYFFEHLSPDNLLELPLVYADDAWFKDPFNEVKGLAEIGRIFAHMFVQADSARFVVTSQLAQDQAAFLTWDFEFKMKRFSMAPQSIRGATHLHFNDAGLVTYHRDYWDAAEELYEKLPLLSGLMRILKRAARN
ncbi:Putative transcriptional regulator [Collimonas arenae]|uniref:Putative transcriptional regulator n=2 Tax=Collimonas arenae TaxID=279058 RepID=A0A0A1FG60_9BURK|nr:Putative transcriptional regulator [Collimonas arenae]